MCQYSGTNRLQFDRHLRNPQHAKLKLSASFPERRSPLSVSA
jgi:hypothetical protein